MKGYQKYSTQLRLRIQLLRKYIALLIGQLGICSIDLVQFGFRTVSFKSLLGGLLLFSLMGLQHDVDCSLDTPPQEPIFASILEENNCFEIIPIDKGSLADWCIDWGGGKMNYSWWVDSSYTYPVADSASMANIPVALHFFKEIPFSIQLEVSNECGLYTSEGAIQVGRKLHGEGKKVKVPEIKFREQGIKLHQDFIHQYQMIYHLASHATSSDDYRAICVKKERLHLEQWNWGSEQWNWAKQADSEAPAKDQEKNFIDLTTKAIVLWYRFKTTSEDQLSITISKSPDKKDRENWGAIKVDPQMQMGSVMGFLALLQYFDPTPLYAHHTPNGEALGYDKAYDSLMASNRQLYTICCQQICLILILLVFIGYQHRQRPQAQEVLEKSIVRHQQVERSPDFTHRVRYLTSQSEWELAFDLLKSNLQQSNQKLYDEIILLEGDLNSLSGGDRLLTREERRVEYRRIRNSILTLLRRIEANPELL